MRGIWSKYLLVASSLVISMVGQTQVDLRTQSKSVDFQAAPYTRPIQSGSSLPATCTPSAVFFLTTAPAGANIYGCVGTNTWAVQGTGGGSGGTLTFQNNGATVGSRGTANFIPGAGIVNLITDTGTAINIQQSADTAVMLSKVTNQAGTPLLCASASASGTTYTCYLSPTLTAYTAGMVLFWKIDTTNTSVNPTLNVDTLGAKAVVDYQANALTVGALVSGAEVPIWYDGTNLRCMTCGLGSVNSNAASISLPIGGIYDPASSNTISLWIASSSPAFANLSGIGTVMSMPGASCTSPAACAAFTRFWWPQNFNSSAPVNVILRTMPAASGGSGTIVYSAQFACPADGASLVSPTFNTTASSTFGVSATAYAGQTVSISGVPITGCSAGSEAYLNIYRDGSGTPGSSAADDVTSVRVDYSTH
jgi:hypothetical protein